MTYIYTQKVDELIKSNISYRFENELNDTKDDDRIKQINKILQKQNDYISPEKMMENKMQKHIDVLRKVQYNKRWQDLNNIQKINRVDKYITDNNIKLDDKDILRLKRYIEEKKIYTRDIKYDKCKGIILDITIISNTNDVYTLKDITQKKVRNKRKM